MNDQEKEERDPERDIICSVLKDILGTELGAQKEKEICSAVKKLLAEKEGEFSRTTPSQAHLTRCGRCGQIYGGGSCPSCGEDSGGGYHGGFVGGEWEDWE